MNAMELVEGYVDGIFGLKLVGWVWNSDSEEQLSVELVIDQVVIGTFISDLFRDDLVLAGKGDGKYGFEISLPDDLKTGVHNCIIREVESKKELTGSPILFDKLQDVDIMAAALNDQTDFEGYIDTVAENTVVGWAWKQCSDEPVSLEILLDKATLGTVTANLYRQDVENAGKRHGYYGFAYPLPSDLTDGSHSLTIRCIETKQRLNNSPFSFTHVAGSNIIEQSSVKYEIKYNREPHYNLSKISRMNIPTTVVQRICERLLSSGLLDELIVYLLALQAHEKPSPGEKFDVIVACVTRSQDLGCLLSAVSSGEISLRELRAISNYFDLLNRSDDAQKLRSWSK